MGQLRRTWVKLVGRGGSAMEPLVAAVCEERLGWGGGGLVKSVCIEWRESERGQGEREKGTKADEGRKIRV